MQKFNWKIYGILPYSEVNSHNFFGTENEVRSFCISSNKIRRWDFITFERVWDSRLSN